MTEVPDEYGSSLSPSAPSTQDDHQDSDRAAAILRWIREVVTLVVTALVMAILLKMFLIQTFYIPTGSMLETLQLQDRVMVEKVSYGLGEPRRGDIVVFRRPGLEPDGLNPIAALRGLAESVHLLEPEVDRDLIKRIIGLPGEEITIVDGVTYINGQALPEPYTIKDPGSYGPFTVPPGQYFMMGDNRPNSLDSRFTLGTVPKENIIGKAFTIVWPVGHARLGLSANQEYGELAETTKSSADVSSGS
ncbi:signal peptidase I [Stomatohabitans albus]|uniref:signal peptidase I n=1 Tax=Stomatohabitans albus TaxID=3110766 RepID=UPI00300C8BAB